MKFEISKELAEGIIEADHLAKYGSDENTYYCEPMYDFIELLKKSFDIS